MKGMPINMRPVTMRVIGGALVLLLSLLWAATGNSVVLAQGTEDAPQLRELRGLVQANQLFQGDLRVERGQVIQGDAVVYDGDVHIESGGRITGNLVVFDGNVNMDNGGTVEGNVDLFAGDADVAGTIRGNLTLWAGDASLANAARVMGNVSVLAGDVARAPGATVGGQVLQGPNLNITPPSVPQPFGFQFRWPPSAQVTPEPVRTASFFQAVMAFFARVLGAVLITGLVAVVVGLLVHVRPDTVAAVRTRIVERTARTFVIGLAANLILGMLGGLLAITICLLPIALAPMLILLAINLLGWAALAQLVGQRLESYTLRPLDSWMWAGAGAVVLTGSFALLWAFGGPFRFLGNSILLLVSSFGAGAVLYPWITRILQPKPAPMGKSGPQPTAMPTAMVSAPPAVVAADDAARSTETVSADTSTSAGFAPEDRTVEARPATPEPVELPPAGLAAPDAPAQVPDDDFTELRGVGPVLDSRLKEAGIRTFAQLAELSAAEVAEIAGWPEARVTRGEIIEQAAAKVNG